MEMLFTAGVIIVVIYGAWIDAAWAPAVNTALIVALALVHAVEARRRARVDRKAEAAARAARDAKRAAGAIKRDHGDRDTGQRRRVTD